MTLEHLFPEPHPTKATFKKNRFPFSAVAKFLGVTHSYACSMLSGTARVTPENDQKLRELAQLLENQEVNANG